jgi:signal transduction histidine kinase
MSAPAPAQPRDRLSERWRSSTTRLIVVYGAFFVAWTVVLAGVANWQISRYFDHVVDQILEQRAHYLASVERARLPALLAATSELDLRGAMSSGLFDAAGRYLSGDIDRLPPDLPADGAVHPLPGGVQRISGERGTRTRGVAVRLGDGSVMMLVRDYRVIDQVGVILRGGLLWALSLTLIPGLLGGFLLSRGPLRRVRGIETAIQPVMRGDLGARLPVSGRRDELDMLATIVNRMLEQIERLLGEVKGVSDSIAHDLRTPLTRLRAQLHRARQSSEADDPRSRLVEQCIVDADALLERFRALLRISELEDLRRRSGFGEVDAGETLRRVHELYAPLAEEKGVALMLRTEAPASLHADAHLLFEALANLVENAIKFTPTKGTVALRASGGERGARFDVFDSGPGIAPGEREAVLRRFYRASGSGGEHGHGLGLPLVAAIARLHGYRFEIADNDPCGTRATLYCWPADDDDDALARSAPVGGYPGRSGG